MFESPDAEALIERAQMHEQLAANTADLPARKMHQAMAEAYRRKAQQADTPIIPLETTAEPMLANHAI
jgi:hypothetical protein